MAKQFTVYSLLDTVVVVNHASVGKKTLSGEQNGGGQVSIAYASDMTSQTATATGYVVINRMVSRAGTVTFEIPQNSPSDLYLRRLAAYLNTCVAAEVAQTVITIRDDASGIKYTCSGCTLQKRPDRTYAQQSSNLNYTFLVAEIKEDG